MPRDAQSAAMDQQPGMGDSGDKGANGIGSAPGGGLGAPIDSPDPLTKYKWWILTLLAMLLIAASAFLLRRKSEAVASGPLMGHDAEVEAKLMPAFVRTDPRPVSPPAARPSTPTIAKAALLNILKEEMFAIGREKVSGTLPPPRVHGNQGRAGGSFEKDTECAGRDRTFERPLRTRDLSCVPETPQVAGGL